MVCIAAFIIFCLLSVFVAILSIFKRDLGKKYWKTFKKAWGCVGKKVTLQKCEMGFKDDIKNSVLSKVIVKKPKLVKPISVGIEVVAVLIVVVTVWSLVTAVKSGLALWTLGTCDVVHPSACIIGAEVCSIDGDEPKNVVEYVGRWFEDWGEIFLAVPDKFRSWEVSEFDLSGVVAVGTNLPSDAPGAFDIMDPGCIVCLQSYRNQLNSGFFDKYSTVLVPYPIQNPDGSYKFANSDLIVRYIFAADMKGVPESTTEVEGQTSMGQAIFGEIFTEFNEDHIIYQTVFNDYLNRDEARELLEKWLAKWGYSEDEIVKIREIAESDAVTDKIAKNKDIVENNIHAKGIPTMIYDNKKHTGRYEAE
ncbi:MAG: hypothetical protein LBT19_01730 [Candidatus Nomurabacteria bacterium]|jgi:hypothetical protein|nr:hypothetical protein [Candidatus Nomurabacteria bacterium]